MLVYWLSMWLFLAKQFFFRTLGIRCVLIFGDFWHVRWFLICMQRKKVILKVFMLKPSINLAHFIMTHHMTSANESRYGSSWVIIMPDQSNKWNFSLTYCNKLFLDGPIRIRLSIISLLIGWRKVESGWLSANEKTPS